MNSKKKTFSKRLLYIVLIGYAITTLIPFLMGTVFFI